MRTDLLSICPVHEASMRYRKLTRDINRRLFKHGITFQQLSLLYRLEISKGSIQASGIVNDLDIQKSTVCRSLARLKKEEYIHIGLPRGQRGKSLSITEKGRKKLTDLLPIWEEYIKELQSQPKHAVAAE